MKKQLTIGYLYEDLMNIYGDTGNITTLRQRGKWREIDIRVKNISISDKLKPGEIDLYFFGGGQDQAQELVAADLVKSDKGDVIRKDVEKGVPLLSICGGYQLLGEYYMPFDGPKLEGVGIFPAYTKASHDRMIGNIVIEVINPACPDCRQAGRQAGDKGQEISSESRTQKDPNSKLLTFNSKFLVGFENHSGKTILKPGAQPLGKVVKGFGNNGEDHTEGCIYNHAIGCYMHGSLLPKNPQLADWLITRALETKYGEPVDLAPLDDTLELKAHEIALTKFG